MRNFKPYNQQKSGVYSRKSTSSNHNDGRECSAIINYVTLAP
ncbi:1384_t:CDS:2 [Ambispora gerdemannii]|uniref:1384_t:CDS:1 n=1 Tax=Ambispora gerdemannii TaxID=144530 RepID=A0A9N9BWZ8_9GLOM|nr:1384_t:CDS:2 [Ambispora gerdemannii]